VADSCTSERKVHSTTETTCRSCGAATLVPFLDLGTTPLADRLIQPSRRHDEELVFPLVVAFCDTCALVQITETVDPEILFADDYPYFSSFLPALMAHSRSNALARLDERGLGSDSLVVELASNDGYLLRNYVEAGVPVLGIDPAEGPAEAAERVGVRTLNKFFTRDLATEIAAEYGQADIIHANNVLAHVADTNGFLAGIKTLLKPDGVAVIEMPYLRDLMDHNEFDTIYHEHLCYFSVTALRNLFERHALYLNRVERLFIHGGSLRIFVGHLNQPDESVGDLLNQEKSIALDKSAYFLGFSKKVDQLKHDLVDLVRSLKAEGKSIAAYGAAAKGATLLNYCGLTSEDLDFVVDRNTNKQGLLMPGAMLPIRPPEDLVNLQPDVVLMLAWNFADEILEQQADYRAKGGKFIVPIPSPKIV